MNSIQLTDSDIISYEFKGLTTLTAKAVLYHNNRQIAELKLAPEAFLTRKMGGKDFVFRAKTNHLTGSIKTEISYDGIILLKS